METRPYHEPAHLSPPRRRRAARRRSRRAFASRSARPSGELSALPARPTGSRNARRRHARRPLRPGRGHAGRRGRTAVRPDGPARARGPRGEDRPRRAPGCGRGRQRARGRGRGARALLRRKRGRGPGARPRGGRHRRPRTGAGPERRRGAHADRRRGEWKSCRPVADRRTRSFSLREAGPRALRSRARPRRGSPSNRTASGDLDVKRKTAAALATALARSTPSERARLKPELVGRTDVVLRLKREVDHLLRRDGRAALVLAHVARSAGNWSRDPAAAASGEHVLAKAAHANLRYGEAVALYSRARVRWAELGCRSEAAAASLGRAGALFHLGRFAEAEAEADLARRGYRAAGDRAGVAKVEVNLANVRH